MRYSAIIEVFGDSNKLSKSFGPELESINSARSNFSVVKNKGSLSFKVEAADSVALRAALNGITKLCTVYEQVSGIK